MSKIDSLYPISPSMRTGSQWQKFAITVIQANLELAQNGNSKAEAMLVTRIGQIRRSVGSFTTLSQELIATMKAAITLLKNNGRKINLNNTDPRYWISSQDGSLMF